MGNAAARTTQLSPPPGWRPPPRPVPLVLPKSYKPPVVATIKGTVPAELQRSNFGCFVPILFPPLVSEWLTKRKRTFKGGAGCARAPALLLFPCRTLPWRTRAECQGDRTANTQSLIPKPLHLKHLGLPRRRRHQGALLPGNFYAKPQKEIQVCGFFSLKTSTFI